MDQSAPWIHIIKRDQGQGVGVKALLLCGSVTEQDVGSGSIFLAVAGAFLIFMSVV